jgi:predicted permease
VLGVTPSAGRLLTSGDERDARAAVLSHRFWQTRFNSDPDMLGRAVRINSAIVQVAGVASAGFNGTRLGNAPDVYLPLSVFPAVMPSMSGHWNSPARHWLIVTARLLPGISVAQATAQVDLLLGRRAALLSGVKGFSAVSSQLFQPLMILLCASGLVLLLACANVAGLLLARASGRQRETAVRLALGAGRGRLMRQLLTENLLLALLGGAAGLCLGLAGSRALVSLLPGDGPQPLAIDITPDWRMFLFAGALSLITGLIFGLGPALAASGRALVPALRGPALSVRWRRLDSRRLLVAAQVALSVVLLVAVALLTRSLAHLEALDLGFSRSSVLVVSLDPAQNGYKDARLHEFYENLRERTSALPGVRMASLSDFTPLDGGNDSLTVSAPGHDPVQVETNAIAPGYLDTLGIKLLAGRDFTELETKLNAAPVALISEGAARILFPSANPIGRRLSFGERYQPAESAMIVGVVRDANYFDVRGKPDPMIYVPVDPGMRRLTLSIRSTGPPERLIPEVRRVAAALDPAVPLLSLQTITEQIDEHNAAERLLATLLGCFGLLALVLAAVGLYGLLAYRVAAGTRDIGIRMALGAPRFGAVSFVLKDVWILVGAGVGAGSVAAIAVARLLTGVLFGVKAIDPVSFGSAIVMLLVTALAASYLPARRAAGVDPLIALRHE